MSLTHSLQTDANIIVLIEIIKICYIFILYIVVILAVMNAVKPLYARPLSPPAAKVQVTVHKGNKNSTITDLNAHLNAKPNVLSPNLMESYRKKGLLYPVFFEQFPQITLSKSHYQVTSFVDLSPYQNMFHKIGQYTIALKYEVLQYQKVHTFSPYPSLERDTLYHDMIQDILNEINIPVETLKYIIQHHNETLKTI